MSEEERAKLFTKEEAINILYPTEKEKRKAAKAEAKAILKSKFKEGLKKTLSKKQEFEKKAREAEKN